MEIKIDEMARGTRIIFGQETKKRRQLLNRYIEIIDNLGFNEIQLPIFEKASIYENKANAEVLNQMYTFQDKKSRELCLRPEGTATIQAIANKHWKNQKDVKLWYFTPCYRYERPQAGRYREFYQFGVEWINPRNESEALSTLQDLAELLVKEKTLNYETSFNAKRGFHYYKNGEGFEILCPELGAQKQVCGGGVYDEGIGFALGFDRIMLCK